VCLPGTVLDCALFTPSLVHSYSLLACLSIFFVRFLICPPPTPSPNPYAHATSSPGKPYGVANGTTPWNMDIVVESQDVVGDSMIGVECGNEPDGYNFNGRISRNVSNNSILLFTHTITVLPYIRGKIELRPCFLFSLIIHIFRLIKRANRLSYPIDDTICFVWAFFAVSIPPFCWGGCLSFPHHH
jgi:hypothetical protein